MNLIDSLHQTVKQKFWDMAIHYTNELLKEGKVVNWSLSQNVSGRYAEWMTGEPMTWKVHEASNVSWSVMTMPTVARKVAGHWTGGAQAVVDTGGTVAVTAEQALRFVEALKNLTQP